MNILLAGGAGFIGSHLVDYHLSLNDSVVVVDNLSTGVYKNISKYLENPNFSFYQSDMLQWEQLDKHLAHCDVVYDLAAVVGMFNVIKHPIDTLSVNINITDRLLSSIAKLDKKPLMLITSSSEVYGSNPQPMKESDTLLFEAADKAQASYSISKLCNEITAMAYFKEKELPVIVTRLFNTVGPKQSSRYGMVLPRFIQQALRNEPLTVFDDGSQTRSFCDVRDLAKMLHQLTMTKDSLGKIINVGNDQVISILDLAKLVIEITQSQSEIKFQKFDEIYGDDYIRIPHRRPNLEKLKSIIHYQPKWGLESTIIDIISYLETLEQ